MWLRTTSGYGLKKKLNDRLFISQKKMEIVKIGILGRISGKVNNAVWVNRGGKNYVRKLPEHYSDANTELQAAQRLKFAVVIGFLKPIKDFIHVSYSGYAMKMNAFNAAFSYIFHHAVTGEYPDFVIDYPSVLVSRGSLAGTLNPACDSSRLSAVCIRWDNNSGIGNASESDLAMVLIYNPDKRKVIYLTDSTKRAEGSIEVEVPPEFVGDTVHCYLGFMKSKPTFGRKRRDAISDSRYAGSIRIMRDEGQETKDDGQGTRDKGRGTSE